MPVTALMIETAIAAENILRILFFLIHGCRSYFHFQYYQGAVLLLYSFSDLYTSSVPPVYQSTV